MKTFRVTRCYVEQYAWWVKAEDSDQALGMIDDLAEKKEEEACKTFIGCDPFEDECEEVT